MGQYCDILYRVGTLYKGIIMTKSITSGSTDKLGPRERRFLASMAGSGRRLFRFQDAVPYWPTPELARKAVSRLSHKGWLGRVERGLYMIVPLAAGPEGNWSEDPLVIGTQLAPEGSAAYWTALHFWGMTEQVPRTIFFQAARRRSKTDVTILGVRYRFILVRPSKLYGIVTHTSDGAPFRITDREKTLLDVCDRPDLSGGILQVAQALQSQVVLDWEKIDSYLGRLGSGAVYKRLGYLVEALDLSIPERTQRLSQWQAAMSMGISLLEPRGAKKGSVRSRWRVRVNAEGLEGSR